VVDIGKQCSQLEEYKDAFRIFDRSGTGSFTSEDIGWVMRSLGQSPTQQQIDAIIRDMDLDNDGVIDLAEFMIRMMALTTKVFPRAMVQNCCNSNHIGWRLNCQCVKIAAAVQTAPEEDLKHVFDVLDKSGEGMITADSLRSAIKVCSQPLIAQAKVMGSCGCLLTQQSALLLWICTLTNGCCQTAEHC